MLKELLSGVDCFRPQEGALGAETLDSHPLSRHRRRELERPFLQMRGEGE